MADDGDSGGKHFHPCTDFKILLSHVAIAIIDYSSYN